MVYTEDFYLERSKAEGTGYKSRPVEGVGWYVCVAGLRERWQVGKKLPKRIRFGLSFESDRQGVLVQYLSDGPHGYRWSYCYSYEYEGVNYWGLDPVPPYIRNAIEKLHAEAGVQTRTGWGVWITCEVG